MAATITIGSVTLAGGNMPERTPDPRALEKRERRLSDGANVLQRTGPTHQAIPLQGLLQETNVFGTPELLRRGLQTVFEAGQPVVAYLDGHREVVTLTGCEIVAVRYNTYEYRLELFREQDGLLSSGDPRDAPLTGRDQADQYSRAAAVIKSAAGL